MKQILFVHHVAAIGGASYCMLRLVRSVDRTEYEPFVLLGEDGPLAEEFRKDGTPVDILPGMSPLPYNKALWRRSCLKRYAAQPLSDKSFDEYLSGHGHFDVVYLNNMLLAPYLKIAHRHGCKAVIHLREHWPEGEHALQFAYLRSVIRKWADCVIAINEYSAGRIGVSGDKVHVVYDWIDMSGRFENMPFDSIFNADTSRMKVFLFLGGLNPIKGVHEVVEVFHNTEEDDFRLLVVGNVPVGGMSAKMRKTLETIETDGRIVMIPSTYNIGHLLEQAYCTVSFFTIPHANLPLAESIISNCVCIAADTEESREYSEGGSLAILFPFRNAEKFSAALHVDDAEYSALKRRLQLSSGIVAGKFDRTANIEEWHRIMSQV